MILGIDASRANVGQKTGVEAYAFHIIEELKQILPSDVRVILYSREPLIGALAILPEHWTTKVLSWPPKRLWTQIRFSIEMLIHAPDVLFVPAHVAPIIHPKKTVMTVHDIAAVKFPKTYHWFERWYSIWSAKRAAEKLWRVIVPSQFTREELQKISQHSTVRVVYNGYDKTIFCKEKKEEHEKIATIKEKYGITKPYLLTIGRQEEKKNTWRLVKAFDQLRITAPVYDVQLVLAGKPGYGYQKVVDAVAASPFIFDIIKTGWVDDADIPYLLAGADMFIFSSMYEGFGLPMIEAMAVGVPVIASRGNSLEEIGGDAAVYVDPFHIHELSKKIQFLLTHTEMREILIKKGYKQVVPISWRAAAEETARILSGK